MDPFVLFYLLAFLLTAVLIGGMIYLAYWVPKRFGKRKLGVYLAVLVTLTFMVPIFSFVFEDYLFWKSDVQSYLQEHGIYLEDDFDIQSNRISGIRDYYHRFELKISENDKTRIKRKILDSPHFSDSIPELFDIRLDKPRHSKIPQNFVVTYENKWYYIYDFYKPNQPGYAPTWDKISVSKTENILIFERILD